MRHLTREEFVDLAEGTRAEPAAPHLQSCDACRRRLNELRAVMASAAEVGTPEPSPLFWDHFSARVRVAIASEGAPRDASWIATWPWARLAIPLAVGVAAAVLAVAISLRDAPAGHGAAAAVTQTAAAPAPESATAIAADDPSLSLVASLAAGYDWDDASEAGLTTNVERADTAIGDLSPEERQELERLLKQAMGRPGA